MPISIDARMMRQIIMDHYNEPNNKSTPKNIEDYKTIRMDSDSCIDDITIFLKIENDVIKEALFDGIACTISTASTDILCDLIKGKTFKDALYIIEQYNNMIYEREFDDTVLDELNAFINTHKQAARIKCATIGVTGVESIIKEELGDKDE